MGLWGFWRGKETPKTPEWRQIYLASVRDRYSSYPSAGLTPAKLQTIFRAADLGDIRPQVELYEEMEEKDAHLASLLQTRKAAVQGLKYRVVPVSREEVDQAAAALVTEVLADLEFDRIILELLDAVGKGFAVSEILWAIRGDKVVVGEVQQISPKRISFREGDEPQVLAADGVTPLEVPPWKLIYHRHWLRSGSVVRGGVLRSIAWVYLFKNYALKDWAVFNEVFGMPLRVGKYEPTATAEDREVLARAVAALGSDAAAVISKNMEIEFVEAGGRSGGKENPFLAMAEFCNQEMSKAILGQTLTTEVGPRGGAYAAARVHEQVRRDLVQSDADNLAATLRHQLLRPLVGFNFGWERETPYFYFYFEDKQDLKAMSEAYRNLHEMGIRVPEEHIREVFGWSRSGTE